MRITSEMTQIEEILNRKTYKIKTINDTIDIINKLN